MNTFRHIPKPGRDEYPAYSQVYMDLLPGDKNILQLLQDNFDKIKKFIYSLDAGTLYYRYAPGKWSIKEILVHLVDDERIFSYRALRYARNDKTELAQFEQDDYIRYAEADKRSLENIFAEYASARSSTIAMYNGFPEEALIRAGTNTGQVNRRTVRAIVYHLAAHELWHIKIIKERYLNLSTVGGII